MTVPFHIHDCTLQLKKKEKKIQGFICRLCTKNLVMK